jgi:hypothetical protein
MIGGSGQGKIQPYGDVNVISKSVIAFLVGYVVFRTTPVFFQKNEFYKIQLTDFYAWLINVESGFAFVIFWALLLCAAKLAKVSKSWGFVFASLVFGLSYAIFEFPMATVVNKVGHNYDWAGIVLAYMLSLIVLLAGKFSLRWRRVCDRV